MRIVVCVKQICHTYARTGLEPEQYYLAPEDMIYRVNPYDEVAMELALRTKEGLGGGEILMLTLGPIIAEEDLKRCVAMGADRLLQIDRPDDMDPWRKSRVLGEAIKTTKADLVLCGKESLDTQNGQIGAFLAHRLGLPFVSAITSLEINREQGSATVQRSAGRGVREIIECATPAVFSVDMGSIAPRLPTYQDKEAAQSLAIQRLTVGEDPAAHKVLSEGVSPPRPRPKQVPPINTDLEAYDRVQQLLMGSRVEKKGLMLTGSPESQVDGIISFLKEHGFLESEKASKDE
jgi:electron transfer flavoprotein beta subunit